MTALMRMTTTQIIITTVTAEFRYPWKCFAGFGPDRHRVEVVADAQRAGGQRRDRHERQRQRASPTRSAPGPALMITVVPTASATAASSWFAMPNIGQIVEMLPAQMK